MAVPHLTEVAAATAAHWLPRPAVGPVSHILRELAAARGLLTAEAGGALTRYPHSGDGEPVLLLPGFLAGDRSLETLAARLAAAGYRPFPAGIARNLDCSEELTGTLLARLELLAGDHGGPIAIVGHSRGGMLARVLARRRPDLVSGVIGLASPYREPLAVHPLLLMQILALGGAGSIGVRGLVRYSCAVGRCCARFRADLAAPLPDTVGNLSIFSRTDGIVDWRACSDPDGRQIEVSSSHCGMASDRVTLDVVARELARFGRRAPLAAAPAAWLDAA